MQSIRRGHQTRLPLLLLCSVNTTKSYDILTQQSKLNSAHTCIFFLNPLTIKHSQKPSIKSITTKLMKQLKKLIWENRDLKN